MNPRFLRALLEFFWVVTLAGLASPAVADETPVGADTSLNGTSWVRPTANGSPGPSQQTLLYFHALTDVNGDGFADLIYTTQSSTDVYVQYSNGSSFGSPVVVASDASNTIKLCTNNTCPPPSGQAWINAVGDVNGDQQKDLLFANGSVTTVLRNVTLYPQYIIGSVIYVPPGQGPSTITYGTGTVTGTTLSTTETWKNSSTVGSGNIGSAANGVSVEFGFEFGGSTTNTVDMAETTNQSTGYRGSPSNSIDHDHDQILIFLGVNINATVDYSGNVTWNVDFSHILDRGFSPEGYSIPVGCLRPNSTMFSSSACTSQQGFLSSVAIISASYPQIIGADPFSDPNAPPTPDPARYHRINAVDFEPNPNISTYNFSDTNGKTFTNASTTSYSYSVSEDGHFTIPSWFTTIKESNKFTWTNSSTTTYKTGSIAMSAFAISLPSAPYSGPPTLFIYLDTIYHTFMFSFN